ncbi:ABC transporter ATP-binding protein [Adhaeribacter rhizoryzae]|uniref:ABC transporter ATP-binding protein n=1 Tax=Adhaeribacter rhizoryzae TaxID=2607907 RepID=A0A5M6DMM7_9BACT|nr:ABC transporter ATP-binding protein [Adhaeribacter rhizoryzae]KAA5548794.1 ABC transporter ATP-binding protein [Adhaeribacter rhizoryzae]
MSLLTVSQISIREERSFALKEISFTQQPLQKIAVAGETGSGKSTLLQIIAGLVQPDTGEVRFQGKKVWGPAETLVPGHPGIAYLSQQFELPPFLRVEQVLSYANKLSATEASTLYQVCHIDYLLPRQTNQLSGGERQRIALAKLLLTAPKLLLLDEPFSNLDIGHKQILKKVIRNIGEKLGITLVLISHDPLDTLSWADDILVMKDGQLIQQGSPQEIYYRPTNEYVASLFGDYNLLPAALTLPLTGLTDLPTAKQNILVRPEHIQISENGGVGLPAKITQAIFFGSYYELEIEAENAIIKVKTHTNQFTSGDKISISVLPEYVWGI